MVICGGLELVAAGYVLHEINKNDKRAKSEEREKRRKKKYHHQQHQNDGRPSRPSTQGLLPPANLGWGRPSSAPPGKMRPQRPPQVQGQWQGQPQHPQQYPGAYPKPVQTSTWPVQVRPPTIAEQQAWYGPRQSQQQRPPQTPHQLQQGPPPPVPGMLNHAPTMHFDTKTGKWQSNMLPGEMQSSTGGRRSLIDVGVRSEGAESERAMLTPPRLPPRPGRQESGSSLSSVSSSGESSESDEDLAYGKVYRKRDARKVLSHERQRPPPPALQQGPVELDWYATQRPQSPKPPRQPPQPQVVQRATTPNMALAMMNRDHRAATMPPAHQYSMSQPNLALPVLMPGPVELDGTSAARKGRSPQLAPVELEGSGKERYRAYAGVPS